MQTRDILEIIAILLSPLVAVQVTVFLQKRKESRERRLYVFRTLMATRAATLDPNHVQALNMIDVEFYGSDRKSKAVVDAFKVYLEHHRKNTESAQWGDRKRELLVDLLRTMAESLGFEFDRVSIDRTSYFPVGWGRAEDEINQIRTLAVDLLAGRRFISVGTLPIDSSGKPLSQDDSAGLPSSVSGLQSGVKGQLSGGEPPKPDAA